MSQYHSTVCDNCGAQAETPENWSNVVLHPAGGPQPEDCSERTGWLIRDVCPGCAVKISGWLCGASVAVFRKPRGKKGETEA